jgi:RNA polymerase sigma-70 factor (ECF subfamily)
MLNIARHQALDKVKSRGFQQTKKNQDVDTVVHLIDATSNTSYNPEQIGIREMLDSLDDDHQEIVQLVYFQGYTHSEVAKHLGIPLGTVKTRLRAAIMFFRKAFI